MYVNSLSLSCQAALLLLLSLHAEQGFSGSSRDFDFIDKWGTSVDGKVLLLIVDITEFTPFLEESLFDLFSLVLPAATTHVEIHSRVDNHSEFIVDHHEFFLEHVAAVEVQEEYQEDSLSIAAIETRCRRLDCDFVFYVDGRVHLRHRHVVEILAWTKAEVVVPLIHRWSDGASTVKFKNEADRLLYSGRGYRGTRSRPIEVVEARFAFFATRRGLSSLQFDENDGGGKVVRVTGERPMLASAAVRFGNVIETGNARWKQLIPELWEVFDNPGEWEDRYIHPAYHPRRLQGLFEEPCPDVFWIPVFSDRFCEDFVMEMESFGVWSKGMNHKFKTRDNDPRRVVNDFYYATVDIMLWQIDFNWVYMFVLKKYLLPLQLVLYPAYRQPPYTRTNFIVRYMPGEQISLDPHFDEAIMSFNLALSTEGEHYRGGGTNFTRYNCAVVKHRQGWGLLHPNVPTHQHEGLKLINGTRYLLVSFTNGKEFTDYWGDPFPEIKQIQSGPNKCYGGHLRMG